MDLNFDLPFIDPSNYLTLSDLIKFSGIPYIYYIYISVYKFSISYQTLNISFRPENKMTNQITAIAVFFIFILLDNVSTELYSLILCGEKSFINSIQSLDNPNPNYMSQNNKIEDRSYENEYLLLLFL